MNVLNVPVGALITTSIILAGCAKQPDKIEAAYISPSIYNNMTCTEIISERNIIVGKVNEATGQQKKAADNDAAKMGVGLVLFWPALLFIGAGNKGAEGQLSAYKGQYEALTEAGNQKGCF